MENPQKPGKLSESLRSQLDYAHGSMLALHKLLLDNERVRYERVNGRIGSPGEFLQLLLNDPWFAWLRPMSFLIAQIDEVLSSKDPATPGEGEALVAQALGLLTPAETGEGFQREYYRSLQESPEAALAHAQWKLDMRKLGKGTESGAGT